MTTPRPGEHDGQVPQPRAANAEAQLGGADAVEKTTYVTGEGTSPEARGPRREPVVQESARGHSPIVWVLLVFVIIMAVAYAALRFR